MNLLILKSDIMTSNDVQQVAPVLNRHPKINKWNIDLWDRDRVLRIEAQRKLKEIEIDQLINPLGYHCEDLPE